MRLVRQPQAQVEPFVGGEWLVELPPERHVAAPDTITHADLLIVKRQQ
jgi:hypothetical protein